MDDLVHHCLRELSFDGDLGSNVSRLRDFIIEFYARPNAPQTQNLDDGFYAFVWSLVVQQPTVRVGTIPGGLKSEVWIAPQTSKKRKAREKGEEEVEVKPPELNLVPNAKNQSLESLVEGYGDRLRISVEPNAIYEAITGSHMRFAKLSPMVYSALQIITRGRDDGASIVSLGKQSGYDQKTCFYLIKQLQELNLVVKVPKPGVGTNFAIHRYFFDKSPHWKAIREEENKAEEEGKAPRQLDEELVDEEATTEKMALEFTPIDARHLSSLTLVKARVVKLLKASKNNIHESNNMLVTLGFLNPTKTDRRFFQSRIRELVQQGVIEKVVVPSSKKKSGNAQVRCFRLVTSQKKPDGVILDTQEDDEADEQAELAKEFGEVRMNITIHKQIFSLLEDAGTRGMTLSDFSMALCHFDRRTIELLLARADRAPPPLHLSDLGVAGLMETSGRERRHRYYTVAAYRKLVAQEQLDPSSAGYGDVDFSKVGEFGTPDPGVFYKDKATLIEYQDGYKAEVGGKKPIPKNQSPGPVAQGQPRKQRAQDADGPSQKTKPSRKRKADAMEGDVNTSGPSAKKQRVTKDQGPSVAPEDPKRQSRSLKNKNKNTSAGNVSLAPTSVDVTRNTNDTTPAVSGGMPKKRGQQLTKRPTDDDTQGAPRKSRRRRGRQPETTPPPTESPLPRSENTIPVVSTEPATNRPLPPGRNGGQSSSKDEGTSFAPPEVTPSADVGSPTRAEFPVRGTETPEGDEIPIDPALRDAPSQHLAFSMSTQVLHNADIVPTSLQIASGANKPTNAKSRVNVSHLRRQGEMYRVVENLGGIANTQSKEFYDAHAAILEDLQKTGGPASAPAGTKTDKRTVISALDALETQGRIKQFKTAVQNHTGIVRPARIAYLPHITEAQLKSYLAELSKNLQTPSQTASFVKIGERLEYGAERVPLSRNSLPLQLLQMEQPGTDKKERWNKNTARANQLFTYDDETIRDVLLSERTTTAQLYGFIVGKMARIQEFHLLALRELESNKSLVNSLGKGNKIINTSFFHQDIPLGKYCSLISCLSYGKEFSDFFSTEEGRQTLVRDLPPQLHLFLQVGRSRARSRFLEMLDVLRILGLVTPLKVSESEEPWITCEGDRNQNYKFDQAPLEGWTTSTPLAAPLFWKFNDTAPVHAWSESETNPPFLKEMPVDSSASASQFWNTLRTSSVEALVCPSGSLSTGPHPTHSVHVSVARSLRRLGSWNAQYVLTWHQMQFLKQFVYVHSSQTPLEEPDDAKKEMLMRRICHVTSAPQDAITTFYKELRERLLHETEKAEQKGSHPSNADRRARRTAEVKELLAKKAAEARRKRGQEWDALLLRVHAGPLASPASSRVKRVQKRFLEAGSTQETEKWENDITNAIREADIAKTLKITNKQPPMTPTQPLPAAPPVVLNPAEPSVQNLIARQGAPLEPKEHSKKRKRGKDKTSEPEPAEIPTKSSRRHRFQWTRDYDELARDGAAVIKARCRNIARVDWAAFEQVFPAVPRNTVRQRLAHIREAPGNEAYMNRLEEKWYELWVQHRGTPLLQDDEPHSTSKFDLAKHIEFLRKHIDKNALRVGYGHTRESGMVTIPSTVEELLNGYQIDVTESPGLTWDFMWNANVEEGREKRLMRQAFTRAVEEIPSTTEASSDSLLLAEAALKMTLGAPNERYDPGQGALILQSVGQKDVEVAAKSMISRGILSKLVRDPQRLKPGRHLKISDVNLNTIGGPVPGDTFQDAVALEEELTQDETWREWLLTAGDGDCSALVELVMEDRLDFRIDTTQAQAARVILDWNSKKADDDQIETAIFYRRTTPPNQAQSDGEAEEGQDEVMAESSAETAATGHGVSERGEPASCKLNADDSNLIDCATCLKQQMTTLSEQRNGEYQALLHSVLEIVESAGKGGVTVPTLQAAVGAAKSSLLGVIQDLLKVTVPLVHWAGYSSLVLVSAPFVGHWSVKVSEDPIKRVFPRRWLDTEGRKITEFWDSALRTVVGLVIFRPGISQTEIRWRLRSTYDRQEVQEIISCLLMEGFLRVQMDFEEESSQDVTMPLNDDEGKHAFYFIGDRRWYHT